jgi:L-fuculose-phosphate aldolase
MNYDPWDEWKHREQMCEIGQRLYNLFFIAGNDGNISVRLNENEIVITPSGVSKGMMKPEDMIKIAPDGSVLSVHKNYRPSSEHRMHLVIYQHRPDVRGVVHAHPPTATGFAVAGIGLDKPFLPEAVVRTGPTPLVPYAIPGSDELPASIIPYLDDHDALLLGNHGVVAYSKTVMDAQFNLETVELNARIYLTACQLGNINFLDDKQIMALKARFGLSQP